MKPNFALKLSHDGVEILQRAASGWVVTGSTRFDTSDLDSKLRQLRQEAEALATDGLRSKLIMPDSEVRYATVVAPGPTDEARRLQIEAEIEGLTPYALHELAYDYVIEGEHALVAICAREILAEAEGFAQTHGFNPVSFAAIPPAGAFAGEPFFGETAGARAFLSRNATVERDREPVRIANQQKPAAPAKPATPAKPVAPPAPSRPAAAPGSPAAAAGVAGAKAGSAATGSGASAAPEAFSRVGNLVRRMGTRIRREQAQAETGKSANPAPPPASRAAAPPRPAEAPQAAATPSKPIAPAQSPAPKGTSSGATVPGAHGKAATRTTPETSAPVVQVDSTAKPQASETPAKPAPDKPAEAQGARTAAFSSRRNAPPPPATGPATPAPTLVSEGSGARTGKANPGGRIAVLPASREKERPGRMTRLYRRSRRAAKGALVSIGFAKPAEGGGKRRGERNRKGKEAPQPVVAASVPPANEREKATEAEALTIFGARNMQRPETGFARRGLMLTAGLLLLLVAVAIWAVYFTSGPAREAEVAQVPQDEIAALPPIDAPARVPEPEPEPEAEITAPAPVEIPAEEDLATVDEPAVQEPEAATEEEAADAPEAAPETDPDALLEELVQEALTEAMPVDLLGQAEESAVPTGEAGAAGAGDETALEGVDSPPAIAEGEGDTDQRLALPPALERPELAEVAPASPPPPPPFGTEFSLGPDGLVEATPEGAMTPTGVMVFAGSPSEVPPARPAGIAPPTAEPEAAPETAPEAGGEAQTEVAPEPEPEAQVQTPEEAAETAVTADDIPLADPALAGVRPQPRSPLVAELAAQAQAAEDGATPEPAPEAAPAEAPEATPGAPDPEDDNAAATPPPGGVLLDGLRPQRRPTDLVPPETAVAEAVPEAEESPGVVAVSLRPTARPSDISARVQESLAAARSAPAAAPAAAVAAAAPAPAASAAPNIPTSASVAQQATQARAINLRRVNLIGVFGTPADRRALVRLSNGQVVRVQVGDRLDGGQVSAIGDDELRYVKNGRNEVLRIGSSG